MNDYIGDDSGLVEGCLKKDLIAWATLTKKYSSLIYTSIENRIRKYGFDISKQDIDDIRQNVLFSIWNGEKLKSVTNRKDISYWLAIVAGNTAMSYLKARSRKEPVKTSSLSQMTNEMALADIIPSAFLDPASEAIRNEAVKKIDEAVANLPYKEELIIKLNLVYDKTYDEIARILNLPKGTVSSYVKRAKERLRRALREFK